MWKFSHLDELANVVLSVPITEPFWQLKSIRRSISACMEVGAS